MDKRLEKDLWISRFSDEVLPQLNRYFSPEKIIIFGSRAKGEATYDSDIDVILISEVFNGIKFIKRMAMVLKKISFSKHIDFICYSPDELERVRKSSAIIQDALQNGVELKL